MSCPDCTALRDKLAESEEKIRQLEDEIAHYSPFPALLGLTPTHERILAVMLKRDYISYESIDRLVRYKNLRRRQDVRPIKRMRTRIIIQDKKLS